MAVHVFTAIVLLSISFLFFFLSRFGGEIRLYVMRRGSAFERLNKVLLWWNSRELDFLASLFGGLSCSIIAALVCVFFQRSSFKDVLPICFLLVITYIAIRFGFYAGASGTLLATLIFAEFLFEPLRTVAVQSQAARNNLIWMVLGGLAVSQLFGIPPGMGKSRRKP